MTRTHLQSAPSSTLGSLDAIASSSMSYLEVDAAEFDTPITAPRAWVGSIGHDQGVLRLLTSAIGGSVRVLNRIFFAFSTRRCPSAILINALGRGTDGALASTAQPICKCAQCAQDVSVSPGRYAKKVAACVTQSPPNNLGKNNDVRSSRLHSYHRVTFLQSELTRPC